MRRLTLHQDIHLILGLIHYAIMMRKYIYKSLLCALEKGRWVFGICPGGFGMNGLASNFTTALLEMPGFDKL